MNRKLLLVSAMTGVALVTGGWLMQRDAGPQGTVYQQARLFDDVLSRVADFYVDSLDERALYQMAIDGLLDQLHDPYSTFLKQDDFRALSEQTTGDYGGLDPDRRSQRLDHGHRAVARHARGARRREDGR